MRRKISSCICAVVTLCLCQGAPALASAQRREAPVGGNLLPDGFYITPTATPGSIFQGLPTGLRPDGSADANGAVNTALSPDGTALLILTTGYNTGFNAQGADGAPILWAALDPVTGLPSSTTTSNAEWVFVFDVRGAQPPRQSAILFPEPLLIDEQGETLLEAKLTGIGRLDLRAERVRHSVQLHGV